jgi:hypothetical protein
VYVYIPRTDTVQDDVHTPASHTHICTALKDVMAQVELLEQELERAHGLIQSADERDRETRRVLAAALERIPPQLEAPPEDERESPETVEGAPERVESRSAAGGAQESAQRPC